MIRILMALVSALLLCSWVQIAQCLEKPVTVARKEEVPYIKCQVCEKLASHLHQQVQKKQTQIAPKEISEFQIIEIAENVCDLKKEEADWILRIDIVGQGDKLDLVEQDVEGQCNSECKTIEGACQEIIGSSDANVAEYIYKSKPGIESLINYLCKDLTDACSSNPPPVPKDRIPGEPSEPKPTNEAEMEKILRSMEGMPGAPSMKMYSREELMNMKNFGEDADEDEDSPFPSKLGKILREKASAKGKWKQRITKAITHAEEALKKHAKRVSYRVQKWWKGFKTARSKNAKDSKADL